MKEFFMNVPRDATVELQNLSFHYRDFGGSGRDIVLLHGLASNAVFWDLCASFLQEQLHVLALDQRGHGSSAKTDGGYDFPTVARDIAGFIETLNLQTPILVGHSWGGNVAMQVAADYPDLLSGLVCIDGGTIEPSASAGATWEKTEQALAPPHFPSRKVQWDQMVQRNQGRTDVQWKDGGLAFLEANFDVQNDGTVLPNLSYEHHMLIVRAIWDQKVSTLFPRIQVPVLLMPARRDNKDADSTGRRSEKEANYNKAASLLQTTQLVWMEDSIHDVPLQRPEEVSQSILDAVRDGFFGK
jgi:pimeloyl-ACP methyl ester carboxylesterase